MWFNYIILSSFLLVLLAIVFSLLFKNKLNLIQNKLILNLSILAIILLTFGLPNIAFYQEGLTDRQTFNFHSYQEWNVVDINDNFLVACYEKANTSRDFCQCEVEQKAQLFKFKPNIYRDFLIAIQPYLAYFFGIAALLLAIKLIWDWLYLLILIQKSRKKVAVFNNKKLTFVYTNNYFQAACFSGLFKNYIFWSDELDNLKQEEQNYILAHEMAHLQQKDSWQLLLWRFWQLLFWFNPIFYYLKHKLLEINEFIADETVSVYSKSENFKPYALLLLKLKTVQQNNFPHTNNFNKLKLFFAKSLLHSRISRLLKPNLNPKIQLPFWLISTFLALFLYLNATVCKAIIETENIAFYQYEILKTANQNTGLEYICVDCVQKNSKK